MYARLSYLSRGRPAVRFLGTSLSLMAELEVQEQTSHVYHVQLNRPDRRNTFTLDLWKKMKTVFDELAEEPKCRAIVISGIGKSFCAGIDLQQGMGELVGMLMDDKIEVGRKGRILQRIITTCQDGFTAIENCPKPVIAAIHSHCVGAGVDLITACDIRYASSDSMFSIREVEIGMAADVGTLNRMQKIVANDSWTRELAFTARDVGADEALKYGGLRVVQGVYSIVTGGLKAGKALEMPDTVTGAICGLISRIFATQESVVEGALALAARIAKKSPIGVQGTKVVLNHARDHTVHDSLDFVKTWNMSQLQSTDLQYSALAAMNKQVVEYENV